MGASFVTGLSVGMWYSQTDETLTDGQEWALPSRDDYDDELNVASTSDWSIYRDEQVGIQFRYPSKLIITNEDTTFGERLIFREKDEEEIVLSIGLEKVLNTSLNKEIADQFNWNVSSIQKIPADGAGLLGYMLGQFTGDAYSVWNSYFFTTWTPTSPGDDGKGPMDVIIAKVEGSREKVNEKGIAEEIMGTFNIIE